jgi:Icc protein
LLIFALFSNMRNIYFIVVFIGIFITGCVRFEFSPNQKFDKFTPQEINLQNLRKLGSKPAGSKIKIAVSGDVQRKYKEAEDFVNYINTQQGIDFVILNGDISDFGLLMEFQWMNAIYEKLKVPYISVIGNHDLVANGKYVYQNLFGPLNFSFDYAGVKFICHDTNGREYNFNGTVPNLDWLAQQLQAVKSGEYVVAFSHVPPKDGDFDANLRKGYEALFDKTPGMLASIHSHQHSPDVIEYDEGGTQFIITNGVVNRAFTMVDIENGQLHAEAIKF